ncbi:hypothetical protein ACHQM5_011855 [Ranunculus cassubicifolius]
MVMAFSLQSFCTLVLLSLIGTGLCDDECTNTFKDIKVSQSLTGIEVQGKTEYQVSISSDCGCSQTDVKFSCPGFQSVEPVDPTVFSVNGDECFVNVVYGRGDAYAVVFKYAWDTSFDFVPISSNIACS